MAEPPSRMKLPNVLGIGAPRSGSTWLYEVLDQHPGVCMARGRKEVHYFDRHLDRGLEWYASLFEGCEAPCRGEVSPSYMHDERCARLISETLPDVKLLAILRDPVQRAYSQYKFHVRELGTRSSFREYLRHNPDALKRGFYDRQLRSFMNHFEPARLLVLLLEDVMDAPADLARTVYEFIGVDADFRPQTSDSKPNAARIPRMHPLYVASKKIAARMHRHNLSGVVDLGKRLGLRRLFLPGNATGFPDLDLATRRELWPAFENDARSLSDLIGRDVVARWRPG